MDTREITKDTSVCMSLASRPSSIGTRFHNFLYDELGLDFIYKAFTTDDLPAAIGGIRALGIRGCAISMPFKEAVIALVDSLDDSARAIDSVNTIVNTDGHLRAFNTDYTAVVALLREKQIDSDQPFAVLGSGGMAKAVVAALRDSGFRHGTIVARNRATGSDLASRYGYGWAPECDALRPALLVNATPVGMAGGPAASDLPAPAHAIAAATTIIDVVAVPEDTPLVRRARAQAATVITGAQIMALQAAAQFELYTGVRPTPDQVARARAFSRAI